MVVETKKGKQSGYEANSMTGSIKVRSKEGKTIKKLFYGICGC